MKIEKHKQAIALIRRYDELNERLTNFNRYGNEVIKDAVGDVKVDELELNKFKNVLMEAIKREMAAVKAEYEAL